MRFAIAIVLLLGMLTPVHAAKRVALVIGNSAYVHANPLPNPKNDAEDVAKKFAALGFDVTSGQDLDLNKMRETVRGFIKNLDGAELAVFYYAGHGLQVKGTNYMVPIDAKLATEDDVGFEALGMESVLGPMERVSRTNLVFLDACRDNPLAKNLARSMGTRSTAVGQGLAQQGGGVGTLIAFATQPGNVALDGSGRNSPFTSALLKHLGTPGQDIMRDMIMVRRDVIAATNQAQVPWDNSSLTGDVILMPGTAPAKPVVVDDSVETAFWNTIKNETEAAFFEQYLSRFPKGQFADLARLKIKQLQSATTIVEPTKSTDMKAFDGMWSLTRSAKKSDCVWSSMETFIEIADGKIDHPDLKGLVKTDGSIKLTLTFIDEFNGQKGSNIFAGKMTLAGGNGKFFAPGGGCKGTFKLVRQ